MNRIGVVRKRRGLSQEDLGAALGLTQSGMSKVEAEKVPVTLDKLREVAQVLECSVSELVEEPEFTMDVLQAARELQKLPASTRQHVIRVVSNLGSLAPEDADRLANAATALLGISTDPKSPQADVPGKPQGNPSSQ